MESSWKWSVPTLVSGGSLRRKDQIANKIASMRDGRNYICYSTEGESPILGMFG
jgi:predicted transcriptional regulator